MSCASISAVTDTPLNDGDQMKKPCTPCILIGMMTLIAAYALIRASYVAPCVEVGVFLASSVSAVGTAFMAWRLSGRLSQKEMLLVYVTLAVLLTSAVTALVDYADFTILGERSDAESGLLLGGILSCAVVGLIAVRLSARFPLALVWGAAAACAASWGGVLLFGKPLEPEYQDVISMAGIGSALLAFVYLRICRRNLNSNQYSAVVTLINVMVTFCAPFSSDNLAGSVLAGAVTLLSGLLILSDRQRLEIHPLVTASMLVFVGFAEMVDEFLSKGMGLDATVSCLPSCLLGLLIMSLIWRHKHEMARGLYWAAFWSFGLLVLLELVPESLSDDLGLQTAGIVMLFFAACILYAPVPLPERYISRRERLAHAGGTAAVLIALTVTAGWLTAVLMMLTTNIGPVRLMSQLKPTPLWPGDLKYTAMAMREESLWPEEVRTMPPGDGEPAKDYLERLRPDGDRFSYMISTRSYENRQHGIDDEDIGAQWVGGRNHLIMKRVDRLSPAGRAGLDRGDRVVAINGTPVKDIPDDATWQVMFGPCKAGTKISMDILSRAGARRNVSLTIGTTVHDRPRSAIFQASGGPVGYLYLEDFNKAQFRCVRERFAEFKRAGVGSLILDLRYNSGGLLGNASLLSSLIAGQLFDGKPFERLEHSARLHDRDYTYKIERQPESAYIRRIAVLTTHETCSASESVINGLKPYLPVTVVGETTCGKPFLMEKLEFGDTMLFPVTARAINSRGEGYYSQGLRPDIEAQDDLAHRLGDPEEGMLKKALYALGTQQAGMEKTLRK